MGLPLEKKTGTNFGPPGNSKLVYFLDDLNLSEVHTMGSWKVAHHKTIEQSNPSTMWRMVSKSLDVHLQVMHNLLLPSPCPEYISLDVTMHATFARTVVRLIHTTLNRPLLSSANTWNTSISTIWPNLA